MTATQPRRVCGQKQEQLYSLMRPVVFSTPTARFATGLTVLGQDNQQALRITIMSLLLVATYLYGVTSVCLY
jgi:hypothetical protein